jgi:SAM-dependent methyltransferase
MPHSLPDASPWVRRFASLIPHGRTLDLACGSGRHSRLLLSLGHSVLAVDRDAAALESLVGAGIETKQFDLEQEGADRVSGWPLSPSSYSGVVVTNYLHRPLMDALLASVAPGGVLIYETFAQGNGQFGKPSNPDFLLAPGELLERVYRAGGWHVIAFEDGYVNTPKPAMIQRICVRRGGPELVPVDVAI